MLYQRTQRIHCCNSVSSCRFHIIIANLHIFMSILQERFFVKLCPLKLFMCIRVAYCNPPTAHLIHKTAFNGNILIACHTRSLFTFWTKRCHVNSTIIHVFIIHIAMHIMNQQITQRNSVSHSFIFCHNRNSGTIHLVSKWILLSNNLTRLICNFQVFDNDIFYII